MQKSLVRSARRLVEANQRHDFAEDRFILAIEHSDGLLGLPRFAGRWAVEAFRRFQENFIREGFEEKVNKQGGEQALGFQCYDAVGQAHEVLARKGKQ